MAGNSPSWKTHDSGLTVYNGTGSTLAANLFVLPDASYAKGAKSVATSAAPTSHKGVLRSSLATGTYGTTYGQPGETVVVKGSGTITKGDQLFLDSASGKEGRVKKYTNFATDGAVLLVAVAESACADGELCEALVTVATIKTA
jgi:hypothetical protein